jgi:nucleotide-binding universal stress UspA family protein
VHVLIATDGSDASLVAARRAAELLHEADHVTLLSVVSEIPGDDAGGFEGSVYTLEEQERVWNAEMAEADDELTRTARAITGGGRERVGATTSAQVDKRIEVGDVAHTVCRVAGELRVDVIVVGSHGRTGLGRLFLGSVSEHIVRYAPCPVLVVREPHQAKP